MTAECGRVMKLPLIAEYGRMVMCCMIAERDQKGPRILAAEYNRAMILPIIAETFHMIAECVQVTCPMSVEHGLMRCLMIAECGIMLIYPMTAEYNQMVACPMTVGFSKVICPMTEGCGQVICPMIAE